jgi:hypothetical protein
MVDVPLGFNLSGEFNHSIPGLYITNNWTFVILHSVIFENLLIFEQYIPVTVRKIAVGRSLPSRRGSGNVYAGFMHCARWLRLDGYTYSKQEALTHSRQLLGSYAPLRPQIAPYSIDLDIFAAWADLHTV